MLELRSHPESSDVASAAKQALRARVVRYYQQNQFFYDLFWTDVRTRSMNYGFWEPGTYRLGAAFRNQNEAIARALRAAPSDRVLEAGCGTGGASVWLARHRGTRGVGITLCGAQAERGVRLAARRGVRDRVRFMVMDFTELGFRNASFDKIFASESVCYAWDKGEFVREAHRVLRPGGRLVVVDGFRPDRRLGERQRETLTTWAAGWAVPGLASLGEFREQLAAAGFRKIGFSEETDRIMPSARRILGRGLCAYPLLRAGRAARLVSEGNLAHVRSSIRQYTVWRRRIGVYGIFSAQR